MEQHIKIVAILNIVLAGVGILAGILVFGVMAGAGAISGDPDAMLATGTCATVIAGIMLTLSIPSLIAGIGLLKRKNWARILAIVLAVLHLFNFPLGTAISAYTMWALLNERTRGYFV